MIAYASRTGTKQNLDALRAAGWRLMLSPAGELRTEGFPNYALDNGAWSAHTNGKPYSEADFVDALERFGPGADFVVVPDVVLGGVESLDLSLAWLPRVLDRTQVALLAVQNGMTPNHLAGILGPRVGVFVGGDSEWKEATCGAWASTAHAAGAVCHVGRVNTLRRLRIVSMGGCDSFDGSGASKWVKHLRRMERWLRQPTFCFREVIRGEALTQREVAEILGTTRQHVNEIERRALRKLAATLSAREVAEEFGIGVGDAFST